MDPKKEPFIPKKTSILTTESFTYDHLYMMVSRDTNEISGTRLRLLQLARLLLESHSLILILSDFFQTPHSHFLLSVILQNQQDRTLLAVIDDPSLLPYFDEAIEMEKGTIVDVNPIIHS